VGMGTGSGFGTDGAEGVHCLGESRMALEVEVVEPAIDSDGTFVTLEPLRDGVP